MSTPSSTNSMDTATNTNSWMTARAQDASMTAAGDCAQAPSLAEDVSYVSSLGSGVEAQLLAHMSRAPPPPPAAAAWPGSAAAGGSALDDSPGPPAGCEPDAIKLFVGNIPKSCTELQLLPLFESVGHVVELAIMRDRDIQGSKGSAFLWYSTKAAAEIAIQKFHLRYILHDPVGENNRRLVLRRARARGDAAYSGAGPHSGDTGGPAPGSGAAQMLQLPPAPKQHASMLTGPPGSLQQSGGGQAMAQDKPPPYIPLSYQSQGPHPVSGYPWSRQPPPPKGPDSGLPGPPPPVRTGRRNTTSSPLPTSPNLSMLNMLSSPSSALLAQLPAAMSAGASGRPSASAFPASLSTLSGTCQTRSGLGGSTSSGYSERPTPTPNDQSYGRWSSSLSMTQLSQQLDQLDVVQRGAAGHRPYSTDSVIGLSNLHSGSMQMEGMHGAPAGPSNMPGSPVAAPSVSTTLLLDSAQLHSVVDYVHSVQAMCGAEVQLTMPPLLGCFQLKITGTQTQVHSGKILLDSLLGITYP